MTLFYSLKKKIIILLKNIKPHCITVLNILSGIAWNIFKLNRMYYASCAYCNVQSNVTTVHFISRMRICVCITLFFCNFRPQIAWNIHPNQAPNIHPNQAPNIHQNQAPIMFWYKLKLQKYYRFSYIILNLSNLSFSLFFEHIFSSIFNTCLRLKC